MSLLIAFGLGALCVFLFDIGLALHLDRKRKQWKQQADHETLTAYERVMEQAVN